MLVEKIGHIKNPLTVIAIFAAIAEISGTTVLPFIEPANQSIYIWFLMLFPTLLVGIFFITLNFNHKVLYAPSDYKDEKNFVNPYGKATPEEQGKKLREEVEEIEAEEPSIDARNESKAASGNSDTSHEQPNKDTVDIKAARHRQLMSEVTLTEKLAVNKLTKELGVNFKTDVRVDFPYLDGHAVFDAVGVRENEVHAVEIKLFKARNISPSRLVRIFKKFDSFARNFKDFDEKAFILHVFIVVDSHDVNKAHIKELLDELSMKFNIKTNCYITTLDDLQSEYK